MQIVTVAIFSNKFYSFRKFSNSPEGMERLSDSIKEYEKAGHRVITSPVLSRTASEEWIATKRQEFKHQGWTFDLAGSFLKLKIR